MVYQMYVSAAAELMSAEALAEVLRVSRRNNSAVGITGMLLYREGTFIQALEGPEDAVEATLARIENDPRHRGLIRLVGGPLSERLFGEWSMGFHDLSGQHPEELPGFSPFLESSEALAGSPHRVHRLLVNFRKNTRAR